MSSHRWQRQDGYVVPAAVMFMVLMLLAGLALMTSVDVQTRQGAKERRSESALTLAEGVLNAQSFALSRKWPQTTTLPACTQATPSSNGDSCPNADVVAQQFRPSEYSGATWQTDVFDDSGVAASGWPETSGGPNYASLRAALPAYDANDNGRVWVRSRAVTGSDRRRTVVGLAEVQRPPALPETFGALSGGFQTSGGVDGLGLTQALSSSLSLSLLPRTLGNNRLVNPGKIGIRCGVLQGCVNAVGATLNETQLASILPSNVVHYGSTQATGDDVIVQMRQRAQREGNNHYRLSVANGATCLPSTTAPTSTVFIEQVGDGTGTCYVDTTATGTPSVRLLVVAKGRIDVRAPSNPAQRGVFNGVIYALNRQGDSVRLVNPDPPTVIIRDRATVNGGVFVDGNGALLVYPHALTSGEVQVACRAALGLLSPTCNITVLNPLSTIVTTLLNNTAFLTSLASNQTPAVTYDCTYFADPHVAADLAACPAASDARVIRAYGTAGTIQSTFREIPSTRAGP